MYQKTDLMGQGRRRVDKQGVQKPGNQNQYGTKTQGKRVVGENIQTESTTRNPIRHRTIINKEYTRLGTTGGGVQKINKVHRIKNTKRDLQNTMNHRKQMAGNRNQNKTRPDRRTQN